MRDQDYLLHEVEYDPDFLMADALMGKQLEQFRDSPEGRYIIGRARSEIQALLEQLVDAAPKDEQAQTEIRQDIKLRQMMLNYIGEQIYNGEQSRLQLEETNEGT